MNLTKWHYYIGIIILILDIIWIVFYYYYATVKVYNFCGKKSKRPFKGIIKQEEYLYLGYLWIRKRRGNYYLKIPKQMVEDSVTTKYKIISQSTFHILKKGEKIQINFADKYDTAVEIAAQITVKNYIATSHQL